VIKQRLDEHKSFVEERLADGKEFKYEAENYDFPVTTKQEKPIQFYSVSDVCQTSEGYEVSYEPIEGTDFQIENNEKSKKSASLSDF
jgi:hypothetical protein